MIHIENVIQMLEAIYEKPFLVIADQPLAVVDYLNGFNTILGFLGFPTPRSGYNELYKTVVVERGWEWGSGGPWHEMMQKGMSNEEIIKETMMIEIEYWKRAVPDASKSDNYVQESKNERGQRSAQLSVG